MSAGGAFGDALDEVKCVQRQACGSEACPGHCVRALRFVALRGSYPMRWLPGSGLVSVAT